MHENGIDWDALSLPGVMDVATKAASAIGAKFPGVVERDDIAQEIYIWIATHGDLVRDYVAKNELGLLYNRLWSRGFNEAQKLAGYSNRVTDLSNFADCS